MIPSNQKMLKIVAECSNFAGISTMKGLIALDMDGTIMVPGRSLSDEVAHYLESLAASGWQLAFITGRTFQMAEPLLRRLNTHYLFAVQNGAIILEMPTRQLISTKYLDHTIITAMEEICEAEPTDFVLYTGVERNDVCYYRPHCFSDDMLAYAHARALNFQETWKEVGSFDQADVKDFPSIKCFGLRASADRIAAQIEQRLGLHVPVIRDPFHPDYYVVQATHAEVNKGAALQDIQKRIKAEGVIIAAGDDLNDCSMLSVADIRIVMETAPLEMHLTAHVIAPSAERNGIIAGLQAAFGQIQR